LVCLLLFVRAMLRIANVFLAVSMAGLLLSTGCAQDLDLGDEPIADLESGIELDGLSDRTEIVIDLARHDLDGANLTIRYRPGLRLTFLNSDGASHELRFDDSPHGTLLPANSGSSVTRAIAGPGVLSYRCHKHPNMVGQINVTTSDPPTTRTN